MRHLTKHPMRSWLACRGWLLGLFATSAFLLPFSPAFAQHDWQKPKGPIPREQIEQIIGEVESTTLPEPRHIVWVWGYDKNHRPGAHDYLRVRDTFVPMLKNVEGTTVETAYEFPTQAQFDKADLVVMYLHLPALTDEQYAMLRAYIKRGGGVVALHETAIIRPASEGKKLCDCLGMAWDEGRSNWGALFEPISIRNDHDVFRGFPKTLNLVDEIYWQLNRLDTIKVVGEVRTGPPGHSKGPASKHQLSNETSPVFWTHEMGEGRVFGTTLGHNTFTYFDPEFRIVLFRAMAWAMHDKPGPLMPLVFGGITDENGMVGTTDNMRSWKGKLRSPEQARPGKEVSAEIDRPTRPNVIVILTDDQGYGDLSCHGNPLLKTPALDKLHSQSVRLTDFHVESSCAPTRASLMTGRFDTRAGVLDTVRGRSLLRSGQLTLPSLFQDAGYKTAIFGKWHLGDNYPFRPQDHGFSEVLIHGGGGAGNTQDYWANDYFNDIYFHNGKPRKFDGFCTDVWFGKALEFVKLQHQADQPFFCYISLNAPHLPYVAKPEDLARHASIQSDGLRGFYAMISNIDDNVAQLRRHLKQLGISDNTILVFMTDNGSAAGTRIFNAGMRGAKASVYDGGHRVPCFLHWPAGGLNKGRDIDALTSGIDILPTLAAFAGIELPNDEKIDGISLADLIREGKPLAPRVLISDYQNYLQTPQKWRGTVVMKDKWRLINKKDKQLYNIADDPGQKNNIIADRPDIVAELESAYDTIWEDMAPRFDEPINIVVGSEQHNPMTITTHDIVGECVWNHDQVLAGVKASGHWEIEVATPGRYSFTLRRYPAEAEAPLRGRIPIPEGLKKFNYYQSAYQYAVTNDHSKALQLDNAAIEIGSFKDRKLVPQGKINAAGDYVVNREGRVVGVRFSTELEPGRMHLKAWFENDAGAFVTSAYYVDVVKN